MIACDEFVVVHASPYADVWRMDLLIGYSAEEKLVWRDVKERSTDKKAKKQQ